MSRVLPILFNGDMVRAILDGRKTVTRRIAKIPKYIKKQEDGLYTLFADGYVYENQYFEEIVNYLKPPYQYGDILYVRETWTKLFYVDESGYTHFDKEMIYYRADGEPDIHLVDADGFEEDDQTIKWCPSIHMPKEAARIWLKVTDVRVERLLDMEPEDIRKEGIRLHKTPKECKSQFNKLGTIYYYEEAKKDFVKLWDSTIKKKDLDRYGWKANPYVFVIEFIKIDKPEEQTN